MTYFLFLKDRIPLSSYLKIGIVYAFLLHLYFLHGILIIDLTKNQGALPSTYFLYIKIVFAIMSSLAAYFSFGKAKTDSFQMITKENIPLFFTPQFLVTIIFFLLCHIYLKNWFFLTLFLLAIIAGTTLNLFNFGHLLSYLKSFLAKDGNIIILIFLLAFVIRMMFSFSLVYKTTHSGLGRDGFLSASDDGLRYDATARAIIKNPSILKTGGVQIWGNWDEFYSILLAGIYKLFSRNFYLVTAFQSFLGSFIPVLIFLIGKIIFSRTIGFVAAFILCFKGGAFIN